MRIAIFTETFLPKVDGIVTRLRFTIAELPKQCDTVLVFAPGEGPTEYEDAQVVRMPGKKFLLYPELTLSFPALPVASGCSSFGRTSSTPPIRRHSASPQSTTRTC
jgi:hypothetical protein